MVELTPCQTHPLNDLELEGHNSVSFAATSDQIRNGKAVFGVQSQSNERNSLEKSAKSLLTSNDKHSVQRKSDASFDELNGKSSPHDMVTLSLLNQMRQARGKESVQTPKQAQQQQSQELCFSARDGNPEELL